MFMVPSIVARGSWPMSPLPLAIDGAQCGSANIAGGSAPAAGQSRTAPPGGAAPCSAATPKRVWRLSDQQYVNALSDLLPVPTIASALGAPISTFGDAAYNQGRLPELFGYRL